MSVLMTANEHLENDRLENINPAKLANYNSILSTEISRRGCTENTRSMILSSLYQWSNDPTSKIMNWMIGMAGTGKTTIAYTLSAVLDSREKLAASFFCTHLSPECRDVGRIIPTLAYQLARKSTTFRPTLCRVLEQNPDIAFQDIPTQFRHLLQEPLQELGQKLPNNLVMVIDALDECEDAKAVGQLLTVLFKHAATIPVRFFITSRPELLVATLLQNESEKLKICSTSQLHEIERSTVQHDIETYLKEELAFMDPSPYDIQRLAEASGQLFIYAATAVRYIRPEVMVVDHHERLATMLGVNSTSQKRLAHLDALYSTILSTALDNVELETDERDRILQVLRTVVCLREPVHLETLKVFTGLRDVKQTLIALQPLRSVIYVSEKNNYVSVLHQSFPEYILEPEHFNKFSCDYREHNQLLARRCFNLMKDGLVFNICGLESSFIPDKDVVDIKERIVNNIPDSLAYACRYWGDHIELVDQTYEILNDVDDFLDQRLLFWMEVLNLNECIAVGVGALLKLQSWLAEFRVFISPSFLARASDASNFVASFAAQPVSLSTPHIYISALSLASGSSYVTRHYRARINGIPRGVAISSTQETGPLPPAMQHTSIPRFTRPGAYISSTLGST
ncbi:hypothetical protein OPQ81_008024 [Rhizoctonia solani]|nr:hypothetical protein OPQ81_008024 [Rhizoctonia solani]